MLLREKAWQLNANAGKAYKWHVCALLCVILRGIHNESIANTNIIVACVLLLSKLVESIFLRMKDVRNYSELQFRMCSIMGLELWI